MMMMRLRLSKEMACWRSSCVTKWRKTTMVMMNEDKAP